MWFDPVRGFTEAIPATVILRGEKGETLFKGKTTENGVLILEIDYRAATGQTLEACAKWQGKKLKASETLRPNRRDYELIVTADGRRPDLPIID